MNIAIDYDETYTADPDFWDAVIKFGRQSGHSFVCITGRHRPPEADERQPPMPVYTSPDKYKSWTAAKHDLQINVWIDDAPGSIESGRMVEWEDE